MFVDFAGSHCLVTGGAGFIGSHVAEALLASGAGQVRVLDNFSTGFQHNLDAIADRVTCIQGDAADRSTAREAMAGVDYVFHLAAMASVPRSIREPDLCHRWTAGSTVNLLTEAASAKIQRFVLASTSAAYGDSAFTAKRENDPLRPLSPYAAAKLASEMYCRAFTASLGVETVVLRFFNVFGPRQDPNSEYSAVIPRFVAKLLSGERPIVYGDGQQSRDFVYVSDVVRANLLAATVPGIAGEVFNVGRGSSTTLVQLLEVLAELLERPIEPIYQPPRPGDVRDSLADVSRMQRELGCFAETSVREGLQHSIDYYRQLVERSGGS
jgi:nucleoside-diphosphate-sugar epimerase